MSKLTISPVASGYRANSVLNQNFSAISAALENTLSRDGTGPNFMSAALDLNGQKIVNVGAPTADTDAVRLGDIRDLGTGGTIVVGGTFTDNPYPYATLADAQADSIPVLVPAIFIAGRFTAGDGGASHYVRLSGVPGHSAYFTDALGNIWGLNETRPNLKMFGAKCDGTTDDLGAWTTAFGYGSFVSIPIGTTLVSTSLSVPSNFTIEGFGIASVVKAKNAFGNIPVFTNSAFGATTNGGRNQNITLRNFTVDGNLANNGGASQDSHGFNMQAVVNLCIDGCWAQNCHGDAVYLGASQTTQTILPQDNYVYLKSISNMYRQGVTIIGGTRMRVIVDYATGCTQQVVDVEPNNANNVSLDVDIKVFKADTNGSGVFNSTVGLDGSYDNLTNISIYIEYVSNQTGQIVSFRGLIDGLKIDGVRWDCSNGAGGFNHFSGATHMPTNIFIGPVEIVGNGNASTGSGLSTVLAADTISCSAVFKNCGKTGTGVIQCAGTLNFTFTGKMINPAYIGLYINNFCVNTRILNATITGSPNRGIYVTDSTYTVVNSCNLTNNVTSIQEGATTNYGTYRNNICSGNGVSPIILVGANSSAASNLGVAGPSVSGSRAGNVALNNLLTALQAQGIITNGTSA